MKPVFVMVGEGRPSTSSLDARDRCASRNDNVGVTRASTTVDTTLRQQDGCRPHIRGLEMQIETRKVYDTLVVEMSGRLDSRTAGDAGDRMVAIAQGTDRRVVLNLEKLQYVSSAGLRVYPTGREAASGQAWEADHLQCRRQRHDSAGNSGLRTPCSTYTPPRRRPSPRSRRKRLPPTRSASAAGSRNPCPSRHRRSHRMRPAMRCAPPSSSPHSRRSP